MTLRNWNVFGMIIFAEKEATITAIAMDEKKQIERTIKFPIKPRANKQEAAMPFSAYVQPGQKPLVLMRRRTIDLKGSDVAGEYVHTSDIETAMEQVLKLIERAGVKIENPVPI